MAIGVLADAGFLFAWPAIEHASAFDVLGFQEAIKFVTDYAEGRLMDSLLAFLLGLLLWALLARSKRTEFWRAIVLGFVALIVGPWAIAILYVSVNGLFDWGLVLSPPLGRGFEGALVGGLMWRIAYRRQKPEKAAEVFS